VLAELDTDTGLLSWVNAGHPEPLLLRGSRLVKALHVEPAAPLGLGLGLDLVGGLGPDEGVGAVVSAVDEGSDLGVEVFGPSRRCSVGWLGGR